MTDYDPQAGRRMPDDPELTSAQADAADDDVAEALRQLAELASDDEDLDAVLAQVAGFAVIAVPGADGAGVTVLTSADDRAVLAWAATEDVVREIDRLQYEVCDEGPCLTAMQTRRPVVSGSIGSDERWRRFGGGVARLAVHSALAVPLVVDDQVVGSINIYAYGRDAFTEHAVHVAERFAAPAAVSVRTTRVLRAARDRASHLQAALTSRGTIDQAIGILRSRSGSTEAEAFARLRQISQAEGVKVAEVAARLVDEAVRRARAR